MSYTLETIERKYALTKIDAGDYLLPSNDGRTFWRLRKYTDGPSQGLDLPSDREFWGVWRWTGSTDPEMYLDTDDWDRWELHADMYDTRQLAINIALRAGTHE